MNMSTIQTLSNTKVSRIFFYGLACVYVALLLLFVVLSQYKGFIVVAILIGLYFIRHSERVLNHPRYHPVAAVSPLVEIILLFLLFLRSGTEIESIVFVLFAADLLLHYKSWYALPFAYGGFLAYILLWPGEGEDIWSNVIGILSYSCLVIPIWSTKLLLNQRELSLRLNDALIQESRTREEMAALKERTRIAEEVHDTVGHTLTTAIVALEGAQLLFEKRPEEAYRKILVAREQMKEGLGNIRQVVKTLKAADGTTGGLGLKEGISKIISDTAKQTGVRFIFHYEVAAPLISLQEYVVLSAIKESITNALKHGKADVIEIAVLEQQDTIHIAVKDDGRGSDSVVYGFGLNTMEERIVAIGGQFSVESEPMNGFALHIRMPVARGMVHG
ncbi:sensor histidine kinase [Paenibacillus oenotherae]|uniref:histidine kinase n=1 Tax=Paenibacillus oenotherae TaxID=1435645 RepID=A0ABS7D2A7_9BACL|nr:sensor histidine kinase [Paenibacillus oenotherae]MBW7473921.1 sensor histidine kinase [Paenibacillus oenotherae]